MGKESPIVAKSFDFSLTIIRLYQKLQAEKNLSFQNNYSEAAQALALMSRKQVQDKAEKIFFPKCL
jgi:hypothetical protein